jgi:Domain of unknown function (DUF6265)
MAVTRSTVVLVLALLGMPAPVDLESRALILQPASVLPAWIAGCWSGTRDGERFHERWTLADASTLLGVSHTVKDGKMTAFEFLRVVVKDGRAVYVAQPGGVPPTEFVAASMTAERIVFENPAHDFPNRVIYERSGADRLTAAIDGGASSNHRVEFAMTREDCGR